MVSSRVRTALKLLGAAIVLSMMVMAFRAGGRRVESFDSRPAGIMNTQTHLQVFARHDDASAANKALDRAERVLRDVEVKMSATIEMSELSRLNRGKPGEFVALSPATLEVLRASRELTGQTRGTFDPTCGPLFNLWQKAGKRQRVPSQAEIDAARAACGWRHFALEDKGARRLHEDAGIGLGGIAKGYAVDRAIEAMPAPEILGGLVNLAGHIRFFGQGRSRAGWTVGVQDPFNADAVLCSVTLAAGGICTSGNYERYIEIKGKRFHHIVDPRTGWPATLAPSVTVTAPAVLTCEGWSKCLSVLGPEGLALLPPGAGVEALVISGGPKDWTWQATPGFEKLLASPLPPERRGPSLPATRAGAESRP